MSADDLAREPSLVSVVIPCYNGRAYIRDAISSVLAQTYLHLEIIVVDDGSSDDSREVVRSIGDPRLRLLSHGSNRGIAAARNTGVRDARGVYVAFLDQDDIWYPQKLEKQVPILNGDSGGGIGLVFSAREVSRNGKTIRVSRDLAFPRPLEEASRREVLAAFLSRNFVWLISALVRRRCFDDVGFFDESIRSGADDLEFCVRVAARYRFSYSNEVLVRRREHGKNYTDPTRMLRDDLAIVERIVEIEPSLRPLGGKRRAELYFRCGRWWQDRGESEKAKEAFRNSLEHDSTRIKVRGALALAALGAVGNAAVRFYNRARYGARNQGRRNG